MPELPEVEVTRRGVAPHIEGRVVDSVLMRRGDLRWPFPPGLSTLLAGQTILHTGRRGKYLLINFAHGTLIIHLGMSGHLRVLPSGTEPKKHDHFDLVVRGKDGKQVLRMNDPRRFGAVLWHGAGEGALEDHALLRGLGVEPLDDTFSGALLHRATRKRAAPIKQVLLAGDLVVGVGNIYACEALFLAGIRPTVRASRLGRVRAARLHAAIRAVLARAVARGGSTLRDFSSANGDTGHFQLEAAVYGRAGEPCRTCGSAIAMVRQGQRSTYFCHTCQRF